ncbi:MAG: CBU_0592 family membrane protein [Candidatus Rokuibacteriota bacterium]
MEQVLSVVGALIILAAYAANQRGRLDRTDRLYSALNFVGAALLTVVAYRAGQWGFVLLEGVWTLISLPPLIVPPRRSPGRRGTV